jgi:hypothetical protein
VTAATRIIEYQVLSWGDLDGMGDLQVQLKEAMGMKPHVGILRCATVGGKKVTFAGDAAATSELVSSGAASNPEGIAISKSAYPVSIDGWPYR